MCGYSVCGCTVCVGVWCVGIRCVWVYCVLVYGVCGCAVWVYGVCGCSVCGGVQCVYTESSSIRVGVGAVKAILGRQLDYSWTYSYLNWGVASSWNL